MLIAVALTARAAPSDLAACASGDGPACVRAAAAVSPLAPDRAARLLVEGCVAGHRPACEALPKTLPFSTTYRLVDECIQHGGPACDIAAARDPNPVHPNYRSIECTSAGAPDCGDVDPGQGPAVEATWGRPVRDLRVVAPGRAVSSAPPGWPVDGPVQLDADHLGLSGELQSIVVDGTQWLARDRDGRLWTGRAGGAALPVDGPPLDPDDRLEALALHRDLALAVSAQAVRWFHPATGKAVGEPIPIPIQSCTFATLSDDGRYLACSSLDVASVVRLEGARFQGRWEIAPTAPTATPVRRRVGRVGLGTDAVGSVELPPPSPVSLEVVSPAGATPVPVDPLGRFFTAWPDKAEIHAVARAGDLMSTPTPPGGPRSGWAWDVVLRPVASVEVHVAPPVEGTEVSAVQRPGLGGILAHATTDARGVARLEVPRGERFGVIARAPDGRIAQVEPEPGAERISAPLAAPGPLDTVPRVVDETGRPVRGALFVLGPALASDAEGRLPPLHTPAPDALWLWIGDRGAKAVRRGADYVLGTASIEVPGSLPGGSEVLAMRDGGEVALGTPAADGFVVEGLLAGRWTVVTWSPEHGASLATVDLAVGQRAQVTPRPGRTLRGVVVEPDGTPGVGLAVTAQCGSGDLPLGPHDRIETWTRADGSFVVEGMVGPGPWEITAKGYGRAVHEAVTDGATLTAQ